MAREHVAEIDRKIGDLTALRQELVSPTRQCGRGTVAQYRIIEALGP